MRVALVGPTSEENGGVAWYLGELATALSTVIPDLELLSDSSSGRIPPTIRVTRCWNRGVLYPFQIARAVRRSEPFHVVHVQHEFLLYGGPTSALVFPLLLLLLRKSKASVIVTLHGVLPLSDVDRGLVAQTGVRSSVRLARFVVRTLTRTICSIADCVIVHEEHFADILAREYRISRGKLEVVPIGARSPVGGSRQEEARSFLGIGEPSKVILFFGYINQRKGIETLLDAFVMGAGDHPEWRLVVAGGKPPTTPDQGQYEAYLQTLQERIPPALRSRVHFPGYVPSDLVAYYFNASDVVVLPYRYALSSSGPLSIALPFGKPIVASDFPPFRQTLSHDRLLFSPGSAKDLHDRLTALLDSDVAMKEAEQIVTDVARLRSWENVAQRMLGVYLRVRRAASPVHASGPAPE